MALLEYKKNLAGLARFIVPGIDDERS